jgi:hypothetical protein
MGAERQQGGFYQRFLFEGFEESPRHGQDGEARSLSVRFEESQAPTALDPARALAVNLMEEVTDRDNLNRAYRRVMANKGVAGVDGLTVGGLKAWIAEHKDEISASLLDGSYQPQPVRGVQIPKPGGGVRQLGIPTVWIGSFSRPSCKCWRNSWTQRSRPQASASDRDAGHTTRWPKPAATWPRDAPWWWTSIWKSSLTG